MVEEHGLVDALERARHHVRAEERLVGVDADPPDLLLLRRVERAEAAAARDLEDDAGAVRDLVSASSLHLATSSQSCEYPFSSLIAGIGRLRARLVARDEAVDRRLLHAADGADRCRRRRRFAASAAGYAGEVADLLLLEEQADDVLRLAREASTGRRR